MSRRRAGAGYRTSRGASTSSSSKVCEAHRRNAQAVFREVLPIWSRQNLGQHRKSSDESRAQGCPRKGLKPPAQEQQTCQRPRRAVRVAMATLEHLSPLPPIQFTRTCVFATRLLWPTPQTALDLGSPVSLVPRLCWRLPAC